jgi:hypothetical protein
MKKLIPLLFALLGFACTSSHSAFRQNQTLKNKSVNEDIEWSHTWMVSVNERDLPRVLIIGDSHVERYYPIIANKLKDKAYCCKFTTSRSLGDPAFIEQLKGIFFSYKFDIISFNNGLHGVDYTSEQYSSYIPVVFKLFNENNPGLKLIWVNTTAIRSPDNLTEFEEDNSLVINRNKAVEEFAKEKNIPLVDFYSLSINYPEYYEKDGVHFNKIGVEAEANAVTVGILKTIDSLNTAKKNIK